MSAILLSRFLLHLQSANLRALSGRGSSAHAATTMTSPHGSIVFERVVGSLGASLVAEDFLSGARELTDVGDDDADAGAHEVRAEDGFEHAPKVESVA